MSWACPQMAGTCSQGGKEGGRERGGEGGYLSEEHSETVLALPAFLQQVGEEDGRLHVPEGVGCSLEGSEGGEEVLEEPVEDLKEGGGEGQRYGCHCDGLKHEGGREGGRGHTCTFSLSQRRRAHHRRMRSKLSVYVGNDSLRTEASTSTPPGRREGGREGGKNG